MRAIRDRYELGVKRQSSVVPRHSACLTLALWSEFVSRRQAHFFFNSASQLTTSVRGDVLVCTKSWTTRNFCPSDVTS